jgi:hypothetical protein
MTAPKPYGLGSSCNAPLSGVDLDSLPLDTCIGYDLASR